MSRYFRSAGVTLAAKGKAPNVDASARTISDVILCQTGEARGHGMFLDQEFIDDAHAYAVKNWEGAGLKCRFGHPAMSSDALGTEVGRFRNFRVRDNQLIADLQLYASADQSPTLPGAASWILAQAQEDPQSFMSSIVFDIEYFYHFDDQGRRKKGDSNIYDSYPKLKNLYACDLVDEGAVTEKLFSSADFNPDALAVRVTEFLDANPKIVQLLTAHPEKLAAFIPVYEAYASKKNTRNAMKKQFSRLAAFFGATDASEQLTPEQQAQATELEAALAAKEEQAEQLAAKEAELAALRTELAAAKEAQQQQAEQLAAKDAEIARLGALPATDATSVSTPADTTHPASSLSEYAALEAESAHAQALKDNPLFQ